MGQRRLDTLGDIGRHGLRILFRCPACGRETRCEALDVVRMIGASGRGVADLRGRCTGCGARGVRAMIDAPSMSDAPPGLNVTGLTPRRQPAG